ncbi:helix-turn-helix domain-containing protein [Leptobacterium flavescens]|uniref:Helix-turn-helix domain-containing protein n=1 Tax=Leptobacterium flavescens TaxID=472055 RepID=A0A6P0UXJ7_9FLAO|nr:response regulator transcription factor [Leptobacterium flavescens]NER15403.1 helix-turn-helix domain-containing protein [Leptobacterium flavescens]
MKLFDDLNTYYPRLKNGPEPLCDDFIIFRLEDMLASTNMKELSKYAVPHRRNFFEITVGLKEPNAARITIGNEGFTSASNNLVFVSPTQVFSIDFKELEKQNLNEGFIIAFKPSFLIKKKRSFEIINRYRYFHSHTFPQYILDPQQLNPVISLLDNIYQEYTNDKIYAKEIVMGLMDVLLHSFNRVLSFNSDTYTSNSSEGIAARFEQKIVDDGTSLSSIARYASELNISPNYLSESVKKATGKNAKQVLLSHKLIIAKSLLQQHEKSIAQIADEMGYSEPTNFTKFFKQLTGITPNQFRSKNQY